ncbi:hypothetical protein [Solimonas flava]|uniref:hypothetical protein n=1 Tax=Solimonas flava TaxID=415849 RepID=UPI0004251256|nr:hypothetical protein [Solimonas flava]
MLLRLPAALLFGSCALAPLPAAAASGACPNPELSLGCGSCHGAAPDALPALPRAPAPALYARLARLRDAPYTGTVMPRLLAGLDDQTLQALAAAIACERGGAP